MLHTQNVIWRIFGANLMVQAHPGVTCLGFVDGGSHPKASIVIGAYQLEDNLLQFDLAKSRLELSSSPKSRRTNCANFNFTSRLPVPESFSDHIIYFCTYVVIIMLIKYKVLVTLMAMKYGLVQNLLNWVSNPDITIIRI